MNDFFNLLRDATLAGYQVAAATSVAAVGGRAVAVWPGLAAGPATGAGSRRYILSTHVVVADLESATHNSKTSREEITKAEARQRTVLSEAVGSAVPLGANTADETAPAKKSKRLAQEKTAVAAPAAYTQEATISRFTRTKAAPAAPILLAASAARPLINRGRQPELPGALAPGEPVLLGFSRGFSP